MGANQNGVSNETGWLAKWPAGGPKVAWKANVGVGFSAPAIANGKLYIMGGKDNKDTVRCLDAATGKELWSFTYDCAEEKYDPNTGPRSTPAIDGNRVYTVSRRMQLYCFDADSGKVVWEQDLKKAVGARTPYWGYGSSPVVFENLLILMAGSKDGAVVALDKTDGKLVWKGGEGSGSYSTPVVYRKGGEARLAVFLGDGLVGLNANTGAQLYKFPVTAQWGITITHPLVVGDQVFISDGYKVGAYLLDVSGAAPKEAWKTVEFSNMRTTSVLWKGYLYGIDGDNERKPPMLKCYEFATGKEMWKHEGLGNGSLMLADGKLIIQGEEGDLVVAEASPDGYKELARAKVFEGKPKCWTMPVLCAGRLYARNQAGDLVCLDVSGK
jgi:outer membrane protein assembly factor BamB